MQTAFRIFPPFLIAFIIGVFLASVVLSSPWFAVLWFFVGSFLLLSRVIFVRSPHATLAGVLCFAVAFGMLRYEYWRTQPVDDFLSAHIGSLMTIRATIIDEPDVREGKIQLSVALHEVNAADRVVPVSGKAIVIVPPYPSYAYGDTMLLRGKLLSPKTFREDDGRVFNYPAYLQTKGIRYQMLYPDVRPLPEKGGNMLMRTLFMEKRAFVEYLGQALPEPESALAEGLLLGGKRSLGSEWTERFRTVGIVHIIVLSGYNMTIVAEWLSALFLFLGFYGSIIAAGAGIILFALLTGGGATVLRAAIMALLVLVARATGRTYDIGRALLVAGALMVFENPGILLHDPSFQLSFLAALGLLFVVPLLRESVRGLKRFPILEEVVLSTIATQILVLPLLLYQTGTLSLIALFANILVLPLIPFTMFFAFLAGLAGSVSTIFSLVIALPAHAALSWMLLVAQYGSKLPFAAVHLPPLSGNVVLGAYVMIALVLYVKHRKKAPIASPLPQAPS